MTDIFRATWRRGIIISGLITASIARILRISYKIFFEVPLLLNVEDDQYQLCVDDTGTPATPPDVWRSARILPTATSAFHSQIAKTYQYVRVPSRTFSEELLLGHVIQGVPFLDTECFTHEGERAWCRDDCRHAKNNLSPSLRMTEYSPR